MTTLVNKARKELNKELLFKAVQIAGMIRDGSSPEELLLKLFPEEDDKQLLNKLAELQDGMRAVINRIHTRKPDRKAQTENIKENFQRINFEQRYYLSVNVIELELSAFPALQLEPIFYSFFNNKHTEYQEPSKVAYLISFQQFTEVRKIFHEYVASYYQSEIISLFCFEDVERLAFSFALVQLRDIQRDIFLQGATIMSAVLGGISQFSDQDTDEWVEYLYTLLIEINLKYNYKKRGNEAVLS